MVKNLYSWYARKNEKMKKDYETLVNGAYDVLQTIRERKLEEAKRKFLILSHSYPQMVYQVIQQLATKSELDLLLPLEEKPPQPEPKTQELPKVLELPVPLPSPPPPAPDPTKMLLRKLELVITQEHWDEAKVLADEITRKIDSLNDEDLKNFKEAVKSIVGYEQEKNKPVPLVVQALPPQKTEIDALLNKLELLVANGSMNKAKSLAETIIESYYQEFTENHKTQLKQSLEDLRKLENSQNDSQANQEKKQLHSRIESLEKEKEQLTLQISSLNKQYQVLNEQNDSLKKQNKQLQMDSLALKSAQSEVETLKKVVATILSAIYRENPALLLPERNIRFYLDEYSKKSPKGYNPALLGNIREVILQHFTEVIDPYMKIIDSDGI